MKMKKILIWCFLVLIFLAVFIFVNVYLNEIRENLKSEKIQNELSKKGHWFYNLDKLDKNDQCVKGIIEQINYLKNENLSESITFDKYPALVFDGELKGLDISSSNSARMFRTAIRYDLENTGIDFAGHYTIASVGMTGWGENYWIVDRENGKAYEFPYHADFIDFKKDSGLIVIDPKYMIIDYMKNSKNYFDFCMPEIWLPKYYEIRPSYVFWDSNENKIKIIDNPKNAKPIKSPFWENFH